MCQGEFVYCSKVTIPMEKLIVREAVIVWDGHFMAYHITYTSILPLTSNGFKR